MHVQTSVLKHAAASHHIRELRARDHSTHRHTGASRCVALWRSWTARRPQTTHPVLAIDGFMTQHEPRAPVFATASDPKDLPARTRHRVQDLVRATADNRSRTGQAARRERCHTEPCIKRDGRACARFATAGGPPRGAPEDGLLQARGEAQSGLARGSQIGAGKARAEAGESLEAGLDGAESPAPEADRPSGRRAARWKECSTLRAAAGWVRRWSSGCGAGARASNRAPCTSYGSAPPKLSVGSGAPWTSTVRL